MGTTSPLSLCRHCAQCMQPVDVAWAKPSNVHFSTLVAWEADEDVCRLLGTLLGREVTDASAAMAAAMAERVKFLICGLDAYMGRTTWSTCMKAFRVAGFCQLDPRIVLDRLDVGMSATATMILRRRCS